MIDVLRAGFLTTVQDLGRPGFEHLGVSPAGVADPLSARIANLLIGNAENDAVLECTALGPRLQFSMDTWIAVCGGRFECNVSMWRSVRVQAGFILDVGRAYEGFRCCVAVCGGVRAERYLGSASVHLASGFGTPMVRGDSLTADSRSRGVERGVGQDVPRARGVVRVTVGPDALDFSSLDMFRFFSQDWRVTQESSRQGIRLDGAEPITAASSGARGSEGVSLGAVQVFRDGQPAILFVDSQTTGGYPVIANVIGADQFEVAQMRPGARIRFEPVGFAEARRALLEQEAWIHGAAG